MKKSFTSLFAELAFYAFATFIFTVGIVTTLAIAASNHNLSENTLEFTMLDNQ